MSYHHRNSVGFTIVELLISISIVSIILSVVLSNQSTYTDGIALSNLADEISLTISQAQVYGIGVKELTPGSSEFNVSYGLAFSLLGSGFDKTYLSFADRNSNEFYDGDWSCPVGGASECLEKVSISRGNRIGSLCAVLASGGDLCDNVGRIDVSFARPKTQAQLKFFNTLGQSFNPSGSIGAKVMLISPGGATRAVTVYNTGQVSVE